ncbi:MAG: glycosyltransferase [Magnetococcales bacterium]|nr:glycosyltransferase [Magnetococcales bacterium]
MIDCAVIPAGGRGSRVTAKRKDRNLIKVLLPIDGKPVLQENIEIVRDRLGIRRIIIIIGHHGDEVQKFLGDGEPFGVRIEYLYTDVDKGLVEALLLAEPHVRGHFVLLLSDGFYLNCNHETLLPLDYATIDGVVTYIHHYSHEDISSSFSINLAPNGNRVSYLVEKPQTVNNDMLGLGTFVLSKEIFEYFRNVHVNERTGNREFIDAISFFAQERHVIGHMLTGLYVNINTTDDWHFAQFLARRHVFDETRKSLVIPTYNENESILFVLNNFHECVDEIVVADGGSSDGTVEKVEGFRDRCACALILLRGPFRGYGDALRQGVEASTGHIVTFVEADATFRSQDLSKMYEYIKDCDMVLGTRTTRQMICQGANMNGWLRFGNVLAAKGIEFLWWFNGEPRITDVGCTYRTFWRNRYEEIKHNFVGQGPEFSPEMMIEFIRNNKRVIEIPVSYFRRVSGESKHSRGILGVSKTAWRMLVLTLRKRFSRAFGTVYP